VGKRKNALMNRIKFKRLAAQIAISALAAAVTPAAAAGLVEGTKIVMSTVGDATDAQTALPDDAATSAGPADASDKVATHAPIRLSALAGNDDTAWSSAKPAHAKHARRSPP
jgi:hypothetical protein